jgi:hypothetical protein
LSASIPSRKRGDFDWINAIDFREGPFRPPFESEPSIINEKTIADFTRMAEQTGILKREQTTPEG